MDGGGQGKARVLCEDDVGEEVHRDEADVEDAVQRRLVRPTREADLVLGTEAASGDDDVVPEPVHDHGQHAPHHEGDHLPGLDVRGMPR